MPRERLTILGIDPATSSGFALGVAGTDPQLQTRRWRVGDDRLEDRFGRAAHFINKLFKEFSVDLMAIEEPPFIQGATNHDVTKTLLGLYAIFTGAARARGIEVLSVTPSTWRKHFLGAGNGNLPRASAKAAALEQCRRLGWLASDTDSADAAGIWLWACSVASPQFAAQAGPLFAREAS